MVVDMMTTLDMAQELLDALDERDEAMRCAKKVEDRMDVLRASIRERLKVTIKDDDLDVIVREFVGDHSTVVVVDS